VNTSTLLTLWTISVLGMGCLTDLGTKLPDPRLVSVDSIRSITVSDRTIFSNVISGAPESCWGFVRAEHSFAGNEITVKVYAQRLTNEPCLQVVTPIVASFSISVPRAGTYTLKFWRVQEKSLDTTITVP
jgi:hypothetical protein